MIVRTVRQLLNKLRRAPADARVAVRRQGAMLSIESLEERWVLTSNLYVDFGDLFPAGGLTMSVQQLRDTFANGGIQGPDLRFAYADTDTIRFDTMAPLVNFTSYTQLRDNILSLMQRYYEPFDINVQLAPLLPNGSSAAYVSGIAATLQLGSATAGERDGWLFVSQAHLTNGNIEVGRDIGIYGIATGNDIGLTNARDDTAIINADTLLSDVLFFLDANSVDTAFASVAAHEAAHNIGLAHVSDATGDDDILSSVEVIRIGGNQLAALQNLDMFTRYPLRSAVPPPATVVNVDRLYLTTILGQRAGSPVYVTGTGAHDLITLTSAGGSNVTVTVQAFRDSARTSAIIVPGQVTSTYSYVISSANGILIDGGLGDDRIVINAGVTGTITLRGMGGNDELLADGGGAASATYTPNATAPLGLDERISYGGSLAYGTTTINFSEFDSPSFVRFANATTLTYRSLAQGDTLFLDTITFGTLHQRVSGSTGVFAVPLYFTGVTNFILDSATTDAAFVGAADIITVNAWVTATLANVTINTGAGSDILQFSAGGTTSVTTLTVNSGSEDDSITVSAWPTTALATVNFNLGLGSDSVAINVPFTGTAVNALNVVGDDGDDTLGMNMNNLTLGGGGSVNFNGGAGTDRVSVSNDVATMTANAATVVSSGGGTIPLVSVEAVTFTGGASANSFVINGFTGSAVSVAGGAGVDSLTIAQGAVASAIYSPSNTANFAGTITLPALTLDFAQFELASSITLQQPAAVIVRTLGGVDNLTVDTPAAGRNRVVGTTNGFSIAPVQLFNLTTLTVDSGNGDGATGNDSVTLGSLVAAGLQNVIVNTGNGADTVNVGTALPAAIQNLTIAAGLGDDLLNITLDNYAVTTAFQFDGEGGTDVVRTTNNVATMTLTSTNLTSSSGGNLAHSNVEVAQLNGGAGANAFVVNSWAGTSLSLVGGAGTDAFTLGNGNLNNVSGNVSVDGGANAGDALTLNDGGNALVVNYSVTQSTVTSTLAGGGARPFGTLTFNTALETLTLTATTAQNLINVVPNTVTTLNINGNTPAPGGAIVDELNVDFIGTGGRTQPVPYNPLTGNGGWVFPGSGVPLFGVRAPINFTSIEVYNNQLAFGSAGADPSNTSAPWVKYVDLVSGEVIEFLAYEATFRGGIQVVTADVTGDFIPEIIVAPGRGRAPEIRVFTNGGVELTQFRTMAYASNAMNGVNIAVGDVNGDGRNDIIAAPGRGVAEVRVFRNDFGVLADPILNDPIYRFNAFPKTFIGGASVGAGDLDGDGRAEIIVGSGSGMAAQVVVFNTFGPFALPTIAPAAATPANPPIAWAIYSGFFASTFKGGVSSISVGQIAGSLTPDIVVGQGQGGNSLIAMLDGASGRRQPAGTYLPTVQVAPQFSAYNDTGNRAAVYAAVRDADGDGTFDMIFTGQASDGRTRGIIRVFKPLNPVPPGTVPLFGTIQFAGITVG